MKTTLIHGLNEKGMLAVMETYNLNSFYFPTLFPLKFSPTLTWKSIEAAQGSPVAADVVAYNSSAPKKTRQVVSRLSGDIPKIEISRVKEETDLNEYYQLQHYANTTNGAQAILDWIYDDVQFCWDGVNARLEWLALRAMSTGEIVLTKANNGGIITETNVNFNVPTAHKSGVAVKWTSGNAATVVPITVIKTIVKAAKAAGNPVKYIFMDQDTFDVMVLSTQMINYCASWVLKATNLTQTPNLENVNAALAGNKLPTIIIVDSYVTIEAEDGTRTVVNPWETGRITFTPSDVVGSTMHAPLADEMVKVSTALKTKREHVMIKRYSTEDPLTEVTKGLANAFPVFSAATKCYMVDTLHTAWGADA